MRLRTVLSALVGAAVLAGIGFGAYVSRDTWQPWLARLRPAAPTAEASEAHDHAHAAADRVKLSAQARANLQLEVKPLKPDSYWRTLQVPGMVVDRPGRSDRGVTATAAGTVTRIAAHPGDTVRPGEVLFTLRLISEALHSAQAELFKTTRDIQLNQEQRQRLTRSGTTPEARLVELDSQDRRLQAAALAYRQELSARGLTPEQINAAAAGRFVTEIAVAAPQPPAEGKPLVDARPSTAPPSDAVGELAYEVQDLKVQLGELVQAGQVLAVLANHQALYVEGRGFKQEAALLEKAAQQGWPVEAEFAEDAANAWPPLGQALTIRYLANTVDPVSRTFAFYLPLANQSRAFQRDGQTFLVWRFRPGQRVRLHVPVEQFENVFVLPADGVVREGPEAYVFRQNGDAFDRKPVHVVFEDRRHAVLANDGSVGAGQYVARTGAAALNRILKAQAAGGAGGHDHHGHSH